MPILPILAALAALAPQEPRPMSLRAPATPLVTHDPYFSVWSTADRLNADWSRHWTGAVNALEGLARIDGKGYRWAGNAPREAAEMRQISCTIRPTRTIYVFEAGGVELTATFCSPLLMDDLDILSRPVSYLTLSARTTDGKSHDVALYADVTGEWCVNSTDQEIAWSRFNVAGRSVVRMGTADQRVLNSVGDDRRIDWGWIYLVGDGQSALASDEAARGGFLKDGKLPDDDLAMPRAARDRWPVAAQMLPLGQVGEKAVSRRILIAYDDRFSLEYFHRPVVAYWRRNGMTFTELLQKATADADSVIARCAAFDDSLEADLRKSGGETMVRLGSLAYRQAIAAHKLAVDADGTLLFFSKENFSNGCIATVDVTYPSAPLFLAYNPTLMKGMVTPLLNYARSPRWRFPFAPHDLGTYPKANGQVYGGGERTEDDQMPVEESGNLMLLVAGICKAEGKPDYAAEHWETLSKWANYLLKAGLDPENQLCTDDFAGHLAHNANLSIKAILAIGSYGQLAEKLGKKAEAKQFGDAARQMAAKWEEMARDGDHYKLAFDKPGSWSQKYNLVWDKMLGLNVFPDKIARTEIAHYKKMLNVHGLPLDNRKDYTKLDWIVWSATLAESRSDFDTLVAPLNKWLDETPSRVPLTDWFDTKTGRQVGFQARSVVGGLFLPILKAKWAR